MRFLGNVALWMSVVGCVASFSVDAHAARVKDLVGVRGVRSNAIIGYGLVVGLPGTGDTRRTIFTNQSVASLLRRMGLDVSPERMDVTNSAAVMVTAELPAFGNPGEKIDVTVSAIGNAKSLHAGTLLMTPLKGADGEIYAVAQGAIAVGGFVVDNMPFARVQRNVPTAGRIPSGATVERSVPTRFVVNGEIVLTLPKADFTTARRLVDAINATRPGTPIAKASDPGTITVTIPEDAKEMPVQFLAGLEALEVDADVKARVVMNERTGTVVVGGYVTLKPAAVAHGNLNVSVSTDFKVSQPSAFASSGKTVVVPTVEVGVTDEKPPLKALKKATTVDELVVALNALGASPRDLIAILQALSAAGALEGELEIL